MVRRVVPVVLVCAACSGDHSPKAAPAAVTAVTLDAAPATPSARDATTAITEAALLGSYGYPDDPDSVPATVGLAAECASIKLAADHTFTSACAAGYTDHGEWTYDAGVLHTLLVREDTDCPEDQCPSHRANDHGAFQVRIVDDFYCFTPIEPVPAWPGRRALGRPVPAPDGHFPQGCFSH